MAKRTPSIESRRHLKELSNTFKPLDVKLLLSLNTDSSIEECLDDTNFLVTGLQKYVQGNHSKSGLDNYFSKIEVY